MDTKTISDILDRIDAALKLTSFTTDEPQPTTGLEVDMAGCWIPADRATWRSWTGARRVWGVVYHGPVYTYMSSEGSKPYTGKRHCSCSTCQEHVLPQFRPN